MKAGISILLVFLSVVMTAGFPQEKTRRGLKEEKKLERQKQVESMINSKEFVFVARTALPSGMRSVDLTLNHNYVKFQPDLIDSYMPFFGTAYSGVGYGSDTGLQFKGKPGLFTVEKNKKAFQVEVEVRGLTDNFRLSLSVGFEGNASLFITSNNRSSISYQGEISAPEKPDDK